MSMAHSLELRPVFLDHKLVEFVFAMPGSLRMQHKKLLLESDAQRDDRRHLPGNRGASEAHVFVSIR